MNQSGFTLLELMVVIGLMALVASAGVSLIDSTDTQIRDTQTHNTINAVRSAPIGADNVPAGYVGRAFVQDMDRLPRNFSELRSCGTAGDPQQLPLYAYQNMWKVSAGWREPYLPLSFTDPLNENKVVDGWNRELTIKNDDLLNNKLTAILSTHAGQPEDYKWPIIEPQDWLVDLKDLKVITGSLN
jgi:prepilin-type N-terminal cleavage/methylation domain-containing protein